VKVRWQSQYPAPRLALADRASAESGEQQLQLRSQSDRQLADIDVVLLFGTSGIKLPWARRSELVLFLFLFFF
jgi:hypothetical protein